MAYFLDLFTPETWQAFCETGCKCHRIPGTTQVLGR